MLYVLIAGAAIILTAALVFLRLVMRRQVASLFRSSTRKIMSQGSAAGPAMREALNRFGRRAPFNSLSADERSSFIHVLLDLGSPVDAGAEILQQCEDRHSVAVLKDQNSMARLAYSTDLKFSLQQMIQNAKTLHKKLPHRYPNLTIALLASLSAREGWTFIEEQNDALIFDFRQERVRIPKQGSGKDAARLILFEEVAQRPMLETPETGLESRKAARRELIDSFDTLFDEMFAQLGRMESGSQ